MASTDNPRKNSEGYSDPTAFEALRNINKEDERFISCYIRYSICVNLQVLRSRDGLY